MATKITPKKTRQPQKKETAGFMDRVKRFLFRALLWFFGLSLFFVLLFKFVPVPFTPLMVIRAIENKLDGKEVYFDHDWEPIEKISMNLQKAVIGQDDAIVKITKAIQRNRVGLKDPKKPIGTFIFLGPTGVGKTEIARRLAKIADAPFVKVEASKFTPKNHQKKSLVA